MGEHKTTRVIEFDCHHSRTFPDPAPKVGEMLWCPRCNKDVRVIVAPKEWRIRCSGCIYSRPFGAAQINAEIAAAKHRLRNPDHVVRIYNGSSLVKTFGKSYQTVIKMSSDSDQIPF